MGSPKQTRIVSNMYTSRLSNESNKKPTLLDVAKSKKRISVLNKRETSPDKEVRCDATPSLRVSEYVRETPDLSKLKVEDQNPTQHKVPVNKGQIDNMANLKTKDANVGGEANF